MLAKLVEDFFVEPATVVELEDVEDVLEERPVGVAVEEDC